MADLPTRLLAAALAAAAVGGCTTRIAPPADVMEPATVAIVDHGRHASLVVQAPDATMLRYAYGDRQWFALRRTGTTEASLAILVPSPSVLGRRRLPGPLTEAGIDRAVHVSIEQIHLITVESRNVEALVERLDAIFFGAPDPPIVNDVYGLDFAPHPVDYSLAHNSNVVVAGWLEALGSTVEGPRLWSNWHVAPSAGSARARTP